MLEPNPSTSERVFGLAGVDQFIHGSLSGGSCSRVNLAIALILMKPSMFDFHEQSWVCYNRGMAPGWWH